MTKDSYKVLAHSREHYPTLNPPSNECSEMDALTAMHLCAARMREEGEDKTADGIERIINSLAIREIETEQ